MFPKEIRIQIVAGFFFICRPEGTLDIVGISGNPLSLPTIWEKLFQPKYRALEMRPMATIRLIDIFDDGLVQRCFHIFKLRDKSNKIFIPKLMEPHERIVILSEKMSMCHSIETAFWNIWSHEDLEHATFYAGKEDRLFIRGKRAYSLESFQIQGHAFWIPEMMETPGNKGCRYFLYDRAYQQIRKIQEIRISILEKNIITMEIIMYDLSR